MPDHPERRFRLRGCLLAGAVGDALGAPVEFDSLPQIRRAHGDAGVTDLVASAYGPPGRITDDTQMTLFTADALATGTDLAAAYQDWLRTQETSTPPAGAAGLAAQAWLYDQRAPGNACLSGLRARRAGATGPVNVQSKGCGTVMRAAPYGALADADAAVRAAIAGSELTHGHPTAGVSSAALALLVHLLLAGDDLTGAVTATITGLRELPDHEETTDALQEAADAAVAGRPSAERLEKLGEGWVAEEALGMSVYCALAYPGADQVREALVLAVNHGGDSDSTGAITGNVLGALHGEAAVPADWAAAVEGRDTILDVADRLASARI